jgi:PadR family transcriptional regulator AphA
MVAPAVPRGQATLVSAREGPPVPRSPEPLSTLGFVLMSLLAVRSRSGYDLARLLAPSDNLLWPVHHSQIYPELQQLAEAGLIQGQRQEQKGAPARTVYSLTPAGKGRLHERIVAPAAASTIRIEAGVKALGLWLVDSSEFKQVLERYRERLRDEIAQLKAHWLDYATRRNVLASTGEQRRQALGTLAAFRLSLSMRSAQIEWCEWLTNALEGGELGELDFTGRDAGE